MKKALPIISGITLALLSSSIFANPYNRQHHRYYGTQPRVQQNAPAPTKTNQSENPAALIHSAEKKLKTFLASDQARDPKILRAFLESELIPGINFKFMMRSVAGPFLNRMSPQDLQKFQGKLKNDFTSALARHLGSFDVNTRVKIASPRMLRKGEAIVSTRVFRQNTRPVKLDFRLMSEGNTWRIVDVQSNGSSAVIYYRNFFRSQLRNIKR
jgi:ABC-type transporter MlaC component